MTSLVAPLSAIHRLSSVPQSAEPLAVAELLAQKSGCIIYVATNDRAMEQMVDALGFFAPGVHILKFPAWDTMPYDRVSPLASIMAQRMKVLNTLLSSPEGEIVILTTASAIIQKLPPKEALQHISLTLNVGEDYAQNKLIEALVRQGYQRNGKAMEPGEFAVRGSILDIVAPGMSQGARIDFFGDTIESIKPYDPFSQLSQGNLSSVELFPVSEVLLNEHTLKNFRERYREIFGAITKDDPLYESISQGASYPGMEHWLPLFYQNTTTLFDYAKNPIVVFNHETNNALKERWETIVDYYRARKEALGNKQSAFSTHVIRRILPILFSLPDVLVPFSFWLLADKRLLQPADLV